MPQVGADLTGGGTLGVSWTDEPTGVSLTYPYEFVCVRKYDGETQTWGAFSEPKVWAHFGADGSAIVSNYIIVPTFTNITALNPTTSGATTTYDITGSVSWQLC